MDTNELPEVEELKEAEVLLDIAWDQRNELIQEWDHAAVTTVEEFIKPALSAIKKFKDGNKAAREALTDLHKGDAVGMRYNYGGARWKIIKGKLGVKWAKVAEIAISLLEKAQRAALQTTISTDYTTQGYSSKQVVDDPQDEE